MILPLVLLFFASGACALVYQVLWLRLLALVFGVTVYAAATVLASFMAGLALGSYAGGRIAARLRSPLFVFGALEIGVGVAAFSTPALFELARSLWLVTQLSLPTSLALITVARFAAAFMILIVPTTLMGATLPVVMESAVARERVVASRIGLLYAANTTGAIVGAVAAGFYFVSHVGMAGTFRLAAATNIAIGLLAIAVSLARRRADAPESGKAHTHQMMVVDEGTTPAAQRAVLWTFALSGILSLAIEIVWFRMLVVFLRPTAYAFTLMLASVLAGIALGSAIATPLLRRRGPWLAILTVVQLAIAISAVLSFNTLSERIEVAAVLAPAMTAFGVDSYLARIVVACLLAILPTTVLLGFAFPIGLSLWAARSTNPARRIGSFYSLNVLGAIGGSIAAGFLLLPVLGSRGSLIAIASLALVSSVMLAMTQWRRHANFAGFMMIVGPVAFGMSALNAADPFAIADRQLYRGDHLLWREEGIQTTVAVHERREVDGPLRILYLDGLHQSNDSPASVFVHQRIGALPVVLHPKPRRALVIGLGGGATPGAVAQFPNIDVDVVELSNEVVQAARFFSHVNFELLERPNVTLRVDDGRNFLQTTRDKFDVITADIILPRHAGAGALYAREYFQLVRNALAEGGLALQWNGGDTDTSYKMIMRTFMSVFPETTLWGDGTLMLGSLEPFELSAAGYEARRADPQFRQLFDWDLKTLQRTYLAGPRELRRWVGEGPIITDDRPLIEYFLALPAADPRPDLGSLQGDFNEVLRP